MKEMIKNGDIPKASAKCPICGCEFMYDRRDVLECSGIHDSHFDYYVSCLCCEGKLKITHEKLERLKLINY